MHQNRFGAHTRQVIQTSIEGHAGWAQSLTTQNATQPPPPPAGK